MINFILVLSLLADILLHRHETYLIDQDMIIYIWTNICSFSFMRYEPILIPSGEKIHLIPFFSDQRFRI